jgi:ABC-type oligopeptide transport system ATPase subunit
MMASSLSRHATFPDYATHFGKFAAFPASCAARRAFASPVQPITHRVFEWYVRGRRLKFGLLAAGGTVAALAAWSAWSEYAVGRRMLAAFEAGGRPGWERGFDDSDADVDRHELVDALSALLHPAVARDYTVIVGENGTGKSTAVRQAVRALGVPKGVVYFDAPELLPEFSSRLAETVGFSTDVIDPWGALRRWASRTTREETDPRLKEEPVATWMKVKHALEATADAYKAKHGRPMTLVIDAADLVAKESETFFGRLQEFAKKCADKKTMSVVFVSSEGVVLPLLMRASSWSRAHDPFEVGDIPDVDAVTYLAKRGVPRARAEDAVRTITGGRLALLIRYVGTHASKTNDQIRTEYDTDTGSALLKEDLPSDHALFRRMVGVGRLNKREAETLVGAVKLEALLKSNVLSAHPDRTYTFHARHVEAFFRATVAAAERREVEAEMERKAAEEEEARREVEAEMERKAAEEEEARKAAWWWTRVFG